MFGWKVRKPSIVGLMFSIAILAVMLTYTFVTSPLNDLIWIAAQLFLDLAAFALILLTVSLDVQWLEIFAMSKFQKQIGILAIAVAAVFVIGMIIVSRNASLQDNVAVMFIFVVGLACTVIRSFIEFDTKEVLI